jgi:hypothetical protein
MNLPKKRITREEVNYWKSLPSCVGYQDRSGARCAGHKLTEMLNIHFFSTPELPLEALTQFWMIMSRAGVINLNDQQHKFDEAFDKACAVAEHFGWLEIIENDILSSSRPLSELNHLIASNTRR